MVGGYTQFAFASATTAMPHMRSGKLKALAVSARQRSPALREVPTAAEAGVLGYYAANCVGWVAPAGKPPAIVARLHEEISEIQNMPKVQQQIANAGGEIMRMSVAEFGAFQASEQAKWSKVVKEAKIPAQ